MLPIQSITLPCLPLRCLLVFPCLVLSCLALSSAPFHSLLLPSLQPPTCINEQDRWVTGSLNRIVLLMHKILSNISSHHFISSCCATHNEREHTSYLSIILPFILFFFGLALFHRTCHLITATMTYPPLNYTLLYSTSTRFASPQAHFLGKPVRTEEYAAEEKNDKVLFRRSVVTLI